MEFEDITLNIDGSVGTVAIHRPQAHNSLRLETMSELGRAIDLLVANDSVRAIVLTSNEKNFVSGAEFSFLKQMSDASEREIKNNIYTVFQGTVKKIWHCPKPTLAAFSGAAVTVGCELALVCDFRIVSETAFFQESWIKLGLLPALGGMMLLPRYVGLGVASDMMLRGRRMNADEALRLGFVQEVFPVEQLGARRAAFAQELSEIAPQAYAAIKRSIHRGLESTLENEWGSAVGVQVKLFASNDFREGLAAVSAKRKPRFTGT